MENIIIDQDLIKLGVNKEKKEDMLKLLSDSLLEKGLVKESFYEAIINREKKNPTGLKGRHTNFALPHTDANHVNKTAIAIATLDNSVEFYSMEDSDEKVMVDLIILLAVKNPSQQVKVLQKLLGAIQNEDVVKSIKEATDIQNVQKIIKKELSLKEVKAS
ncbi:PTS sugar transporter subunit IIA [Halanaerobaculum tunisiense]